MTSAQLAYIARRKQQIRYWPWLAALLVLALGGAYGWLWLKARLYVDPFYFVAQLQAGRVGEEQLATLAALGNLAFIGCGVFILLLIALTSLALWNEHRLIRLLEASPQPEATLPAAGTPAAAPPHD